MYVYIYVCVCIHTHTHIIVSAALSTRIAANIKTITNICTEDAKQLRYKSKGT
jgi:hypothetical protein